jgi:hypothetical protein
MTDTATTPPTAPPPAPVVPKTLNILGLISLILGVLAFVLAVIPPTAFIAWIFAIAAIILGIIGLTRKNQGKGTSIAGLILGVVGWIVSIIVALVVVGSAVNTAVVKSEKDSSVTKPQSSPDSTTKDPTTGPFGTTFKTSDGVTVTISTPKSFKPSAYAISGNENHDLILTVSVVNGSTKKFDPTLSSFNASSGDAEAEEIFDTGHDLNGSPETSILPGKTLNWAIGFNVKDPNDLTVDGSLGFGYDDVTWTNSK